MRRAYKGCMGPAGAGGATPPGLRPRRACCCLLLPLLVRLLLLLLLLRWVLAVPLRHQVVNDLQLGAREERGSTRAVPSA